MVDRDLILFQLFSVSFASDCNAECK